MWSVGYPNSFAVMRRVGYTHRMVLKRRVNVMQDVMQHCGNRKSNVEVQVVQVA